MTNFVGTSPWRAITGDIAKKRRNPIVAAIGYIGSRADTVLPLHKGDFLVCDASERAIRQGVTNAKALRKFMSIGVRVFSVEGLHSKVIASEKFAWIGSANASSNSHDNLIEASVRIDGSVSRDAFEWAKSLATDDAELTTSDIRELMLLPVSWEARGGLPSKYSPTLTLPKNLSELRILEFNKRAHRYAHEIADVEEGDVKKNLKTAGTQLEWFEAEGLKRKVNVGDWFISVSFGRLTKLSKIVKITRKSGCWIVWFETIKAPKRPNMRSLKECVDGLEKGFQNKRISDKSVLIKVRKIYGL